MSKTLWTKAFETHNTFFSTESCIINCALWTLHVILQKTTRKNVKLSYLKLGHDGSSLRWENQTSLLSAISSSLSDKTSKCSQASWEIQSHERSEQLTQKTIATTGSLQCGRGSILSPSCMTELLALCWSEKAHFCCV